MINERLAVELEKERDLELHKLSYQEELKHLVSKLVKTGKHPVLPEKFIAYETIFQPTIRSTSIFKEEYLSAPNELPAFFSPRLESLVVKLADTENIGTIVTLLGEDWFAEPVNLEQSLFEFDLLPLIEISNTQAWNIIHQLRADSRIERIEPSWEIDIVAEETRPPYVSRFQREEHRDKASLNKFWAPELIHIQQAWELPLPKDGKVHGEGIRIAHPDVYHSQHHTIKDRSGTIDIDAGFDFVGDDTLTNNLNTFSGGGMDSVILSGTEGDILGVAPKVTLIPMRVSQKGLFARPAPLLLRSGMRRLRKAIEMAIKTDCHIISISHGWLGHKALHDVIRRAWKKNIIIVAAAGNYSGSFIAAPAKYSESICIAGCNADREIWRGSARGSRVDFCGPAQDVWKAGYQENEAIPMQSSGTSFATALTAGVAALWLAYHGREKLLKIYEDDEIPLGEVFRTVLKKSADPSPKAGFGGIINAERALNTPLPDSMEVFSSYGWEALNVQSSETNSPSLASALEILGDDYPIGRELLSRSLNISTEQLETVAMNCGDELAFHMLLAMAKSGAPLKFLDTVPKIDVSKMSRFLKSQLHNIGKSSAPVFRQ